MGRTVLCTQALGTLVHVPGVPGTPKTTGSARPGLEVAAKWVLLAVVGVGAVLHAVVFLALSSATLLALAFAGVLRGRGASAAGEGRHSPTHQPVHAWTGHAGGADGRIATDSVRQPPHHGGNQQSRALELLLPKVRVLQGGQPNGVPRP